MQTITFDQIAARVAAHAAVEAARSAPKAVAVRAVYALNSALAELDATDRDQVLDLVRQEVLAPPITA